MKFRTHSTFAARALLARLVSHSVFLLARLVSYSVFLLPGPLAQAGDITARLADGNLLIVGSAEDDTVILQDGGDVVFRSGTGDDALSLAGRSLVEGNVTVDSGDGNDTVSLAESRLAGRLRVDTGSGADGVQVAAGSTVGRADLRFPTGAAEVIWNGSEVRRLRVDFGASQGDVAVESSILKRIDIQGGTLPLSVLVANANVTGDFDIRSRSASDVIRLSGVLVGGDATWRLGRGVNDVFVGSVQIRGDLTIRTGRDDDTVAVIGSTIEGETDIRTGEGEDVLVEREAI